MDKCRNTDNGQIRTNVSLAIVAQIFSLGVSFVINLVVPKFISEQQYAYWQMYTLYVGYVGILHFGLLDGIVLRYSQYDYDQLDKKTVCSQFHFLLITTSVIAIVVVAASNIVMEPSYSKVATFVGIGIVSKNLLTYASYVLQITNRISKYAILTIAQRITFGVLAVFLLLLKVEDFFWFCLVEIISELSAIFLGVYYSKELFLTRALPVKVTLQEAKLNISSGILLLFANWSSMLFVGSAKSIVQLRWSDLVFGKIAFAFSLSNLFLAFVNAISVVLFPSLKRMENKKLPAVYEKIRRTLTPALFGSLLLFFPGSWVLEKWLPQYQVSLAYLGYLLPTIVFASKVSLLTNNYLKAYRKEKLMLYINASCVVFAIIAYIFAAYFFNSLTLLLIMVNLIIMLRSILSEIAVMKIINKNYTKSFMIEMFITSLFIFCTQTFERWLGMSIYLVLFVFWLFADNFINKSSVQKHE